MRNPKFLGVYSRLPQGQKNTRYFVWQLSPALFAVQELDASFSPCANVRAVPASIFQKTFKNEPSILAAPVTTPDFRQLAPESKSASAPASDEMAHLEKARKAKQVENDLRDAFGKAMRALNRPRDRKGAIAALEKIVTTKDGIVPEHRHMFRDFGVNLRKKSLPELALLCARRAVTLSPDDDHARFNLARILGILGQYDDADAQLREAMQMDPNEKIYARMERHLARERQFARENVLYRR